VQRLQALGFNAVKLPFSFATLLQPSGARPAGACAAASAAQLQAWQHSPSFRSRTLYSPLSAFTDFRRLQLRRITES
jgi:hypothetical protein